MDSADCGLDVEQTAVAALGTLSLQVLVATFDKQATREHLSEEISWVGFSSDLDTAHGLVFDELLDEAETAENVLSARARGDIVGGQSDCRGVITMDGRWARLWEAQIGKDTAEPHHLLGCAAKCGELSLGH